MWYTLTTSYHKAVPKMLRCVNLSITLKGIDGIIIRYWETAHLPLPWDNVNTYFSLRAKCWLRGGVGIMTPIDYREPARNKNSELWGRMPLPLSYTRLWWARVFFFCDIRMTYELHRFTSRNIHYRSLFSTDSSIYLPECVQLPWLMGLSSRPQDSRMDSLSIKLKGLEWTKINKNGVGEHRGTKEP